MTIWKKGNYNLSNDVNNINDAPIKHDSLLWPIGLGNQFPTRTEKFHYWPWSYAANLFGLIAIIAGVVGVTSARRRSYSSVLLFLTLCLLSVFFCAFLIGYYSVLVNYYNTFNYMGPGHAQTLNTSFGIIVTNLTVSIILTVLALIGAILACLGIGACSGKGMRGPKYYVEPPNPPGQIVPTTYLKWRTIFVFV